MLGYYREGLMEVTTKYKYLKCHFRRYFMVLSRASNLYLCDIVASSQMIMLVSCRSFSRFECRLIILLEVDYNKNGYFEPRVSNATSKHHHSCNIKCWSFQSNPTLIFQSSQNKSIQEIFLIPPELSMKKIAFLPCIFY